MLSTNSIAVPLKTKEHFIIACDVDFVQQSVITRSYAKTYWSNESIEIFAILTLYIFRRLFQI